MNFERSCNQVTFRVARSNRSHASVLLVPNTKIKMNIPNASVSSYHSKVMSSLVWVMEFSITSPCFGKGILFPDNSNLRNLVDIQR